MRTEFGPSAYTVCFVGYKYYLHLQILATASVLFERLEKNCIKDLLKGG